VSRYASASERCNENVVSVSEKKQSGRWVRCHLFPRLFVSENTLSLTLTYLTTASACVTHCPPKTFFPSPNHETFTDTILLVDI